MLCVLLIKWLKVFKHVIQFITKSKFSNKALVIKTAYIPSNPFFKVVQKIKKKQPQLAQVFPVQSKITI